MATDGDAIAAGTLIGPYRVDYRIGGGGMGTVYAAEEPTIHKRVAIKVLRRALADDPSVVARFELEARAANDVRHPAIVDIFGFGELADGRPYLVMSMLEGRSLGEEISRAGRIAPELAWQWAREIADALAAAHEAGIIHRDLKPDNVFIETITGRPSRPRLLDLGLAKLIPNADDEAQPMKLTQTGAPMGTPIYMAPEQWWGAGVDARVDQYAFGVTLFEMLTGKPPFGSKQFMELAQQHMHAAPPSLASLECKVPEAVEAFVARALAKDPEDRFASMRELIASGDLAFGTGALEASSATADEDSSADSAFNKALGTAKTMLHAPLSTESALASPANESSVVGPSVAERPHVVFATDRRAATPHWARFLAVLASIVICGPAALVAVGYAGRGRRNVSWWLKDAGPPLAIIVPAFVVGLVLVVWSAQRRSRTARDSIIPWVAALLVAAGGAVGSYLGWTKTTGGIETLRAPIRFQVLNEGIYEVGLSRFLGFYLAALLLLAIAASAGLHRAVSPSETLVVALGRRRIESVGALIAFVALAALGAVLGAPSATLLAGFAAVVAGLDIVLPPLALPTAARDEIERALAGLVALALVVGVALARIEARQAVSWGEEPTRARRVAELVLASSERTTTLWISIATLGVFVAMELIRLRRVVRPVGGFRWTPRSLGLALVVVAVGAGDLLLRAGMSRMSDRLHDELSNQFSMFALLDPPVAEGIDPASHAPHHAPGLQVSRKVVAVNGRFIAPLIAVDSQDGASNMGREISRVLGEEGALGIDEPVDLAVSIDRDVPWKTVGQILSIARSAGAQKVELLFTRGSAFTLPKGAPPEASWMLARDFLALRVDLIDGDFDADKGALLQAESAEESSSAVADEASFGSVAPELQRRAVSGEEPLMIKVTRR